MTPRSKIVTMNISLPEDLKVFVQQMSRLEYSSVSEYVRYLIRKDRESALDDPEETERNSPSST